MTGFPILDDECDANHPAGIQYDHSAWHCVICGTELFCWCESVSHSIPCEVH